jgi:hypothetical protein
MKTIKIAKAIVQLNLLFWVIYNSYFGWNYTAQNTIEENCDSIFSVVMKLAIILYLIPLFKLYELTIEIMSIKK